MVLRFFAASDVATRRGLCRIIGEIIPAAGHLLRLILHKAKR
jgi:hypothetical protein